jgi:hypothetical protein
MNNEPSVKRHLKISTRIEKQGNEYGFVKVEAEVQRVPGGPVETCWCGSFCSSGNFDADMANNLRRMSAKLLKLEYTQEVIDQARKSV